MSGPMRKRLRELSSSPVSELALSDEGIDISDALVGRKRQADPEEDEDLNKLILQNIHKRSMKEGTQVLKNVKGKTKLVKGEIGGGSFQSMGLHPSLLRSLTLQGYRIPTPIQRLSIPILLTNPPRDLVGMARTGSGKSLAYMVPLIQRLSGRHCTTFGARALILLPTRELALQILKVGKELARGWHSTYDHAGDRGDGDSSRGHNLRWCLIVGGEGMDEQFEMISNNPDIIIATPGRLLHLVIEMNLDLKAVQYVVFDEADRLFEMGFETALNEILHRLPISRQTTLFSATLPKSLVEFARAGLQDPKLVRLDAESKISSDLKMAFFSVKQAEKDACLINLLRNVIKVPCGQSEDTRNVDPKRTGKASKDRLTAPHQTLIFAATKHHVEYLMTLLTTAGYSVSYLYGSLDQTARTLQMDHFRRGHNNILVVTDVAARGIDIPVLENVVNYDFPQGARVFIHRVGRTARAGQQGWAWSFVTNSELPFLLDLQLFLGRPLVPVVHEEGDQIYTQSLVLGTFQRETIDDDVEYLRSLDNANQSLPSLREVMIRGHAMYERSKGKASSQSYKRSKEMTKDVKWMLAGSNSGIHPVLLRDKGAEELRKKEDTRKALLRVVRSFRPSETILESGSKGNSTNAALMRDRRKALSKSVQRAQLAVSSPKDDDDMIATDGNKAEMADGDDIAAVFDVSREKRSYRDEDFYMSHYQPDSVTEKGYSLNDGASSFVKQVQGVSFDLVGDEANVGRAKNRLNWDKKKKRFVKGDGAGADNVKLVKTESGTKLPATYRSGRFDEWKANNRTSLPRTGETENTSPSGRKPFTGSGPRYRHSKITAPKPLDKHAKDYERKIRQSKKRDQGKHEEGPLQSPPPPAKRGKHKSRYGSKSYGRVKTELKTTDQIRKNRKVQDMKRAKNARPSYNGRKGKR